MRPWICLSSSSGESFTKIFSSLSEESRQNFTGLFLDRQCPAETKALEFLPSNQVTRFERKEFEENLLKHLAQSAFRKGTTEPLIFLCGFFGILSPAFLQRCPGPIVNTHPSLLPAFPGLDQKVHRAVFEKVPLSGFSIHLVTEELDGGPIVFSHPVYLGLDLNEESARSKVRAAEQKFAPKVLDALLRSAIKSDDRHLSSRALREKFQLSFAYFQESEQAQT